ncbi:MAG: hypothetical protein KDD82_10870 [Planctomycetes bacterium]|nr:hypothetical protein [Planctomycetota bacterium]
MSEAERLDAFVLGSEALAGRDPVGPAHRGALEDALRLGRAGEPCGAETLGAWCLALELGVAASALAELAGWLEATFSAQLGRPRILRARDAGETAETLAEVLLRAGALDPCLGRLVCAWATELLARPFFTFGARDAQALGSGERARLRLLLGGKLRIAIYDLEGRRAEWVAGDSGAGRYTVPGEAAVLIAEWHELQAAEARWRAELAD